MLIGLATPTIYLVVMLTPLEGTNVPPLVETWKYTFSSMTDCMREGSDIAEALSDSYSHAHHSRNIPYPYTDQSGSFFCIRAIPADKDIRKPTDFPDKGVPL